jgi:lysocardiolipin and lysophospholipid acyltransferase
MATTNGLKQRYPPASVPSTTKSPTEKTARTQHPGGAIKHGTWQQGIRMLLFALYFSGSIIWLV